MSPADSTFNDQPPMPARLNGWKEIAAHFGKGVRTVQRWEKELSLPIHRINTPGGEIVYALRPELQAWEESAAGRRLSRDGAVANGVDSVPSQAQDPAVPRPPPVTPRFRRLRRPGFLVLLGIVLLVGGTLLWVRHVSGSPVGQPHSFRILNQALVIFDADGHLLWEHRFDFPLTESAYLNEKVQEELTPVVFDDIDGDGNTEVLFVSEPWTRASRGLFCFDNKGVLRFHSAPDRVVRFGEKTYGPPWRGAFVLATGASGRPHDVWFVSTHLEEFPTVLEKLDTTGNVHGEYWSNGQITKVVVGELAGRPSVFVGAVNNESKGASLAILDARQPTGSAPAVSDHYRCSGCPPGVPLAFLLFPRLDVAVEDDDYSDVRNILPDALGQILVDVRHRATDRVASELRQAALSFYTLDSQYRLRNAELGKRVAVVHQALEQAGLLNHPFSVPRDSQCLWPVLRWKETAFEEVPGPEPRR
jgi:hypothetical protein